MDIVCFGKRPAAGWVSGWAAVNRPGDRPQCDDGSCCSPEGGLGLAALMWSAVAGRDVSRLGRRTMGAG